MPTSKQLRMTNQRKIILDQVKKSRSHPTADEVYNEVRKILPRVSLGTVYRNLEVLSELGLIRKIVTGSAQRRFDGTTDDHYHIRCSICGRVDDAKREVIADLDQEFQKCTDYKVLGHNLEFYGICPQCSGAGDDKRSNKAAKPKGRKRDAR